MTEALSQIATWVVLPATKTEVRESLEQAQGLCQALANFQATTPEEEAQLSELMNLAHKNVKELDTLRLKVAKPATDAKRAVDDFFRPALQAWKAAKEASKGKLSEALRAREVARLQALQAVAAAPTPQAATAALAAAPAPAMPPAGAALRSEIQINILDESLIPAEYLCIDWSALKIAARKGIEVPGVQFVQVSNAMVKNTRRKDNE